LLAYISAVIPSLSFKSTAAPGLQQHSHRAFMLVDDDPHQWRLPFVVFCIYCRPGPKQHSHSELVPFLAGVRQ